VALARGKGLSRWRILLVHIFRNSILTLFNHMKGIILFALSNLLMLEIIFDVHGFMTFIYENGVLNPEIVTVALYMVFIPSFILYTASQWALSRFILQGDSL
ncbi:MAG: ABC transporter permease subunit, partial [Anaerobacillus sp.]